MTEQERAATLLVNMQGARIVVNYGHSRMVLDADDQGCLEVALRALAARPAVPADLRETIIMAAHNAAIGFIGEGDMERIVDADLSAIQAAGYEVVPAGTLADMRETLQRLTCLTPRSANAATANDYSATSRAIASSALDRLDRNATKEG